MENLAKKVEQALNEVNKQHAVALEHALQISSYACNRSIGADAVPKESMEIEGNMTISKKEAVKQRKHLSLSHNLNMTYPPLIRQEMNSLSNLDFLTINSSVLRREAEEKRKRSIRQKVVEMQERNIELLQANLRPIEEHKQEERRKWLEQKERNDLFILQTAEKQSILDFREHEQKLDSLRLQTQKKLQLVSFQGISQYQLKFRGMYEVIVKLLMSIDKASSMPCMDYNRKLKELIQMFEQLIGKIKCGDCGPSEMKSAETLCTSLADLEFNILSAISQENEIREKVTRDKQRREEEAESAAAADAARQQAERETLQNAQNSIPEHKPMVKETVIEAQTSSEVAEDTTAPSVFNQFVNTERYDFYTRIMTFYQEKVERVKVLQSDESIKKYRFECQKSINIPVNAISAVSQQHIKDKFDKLYSFVNAQPALGRDYCVLLMAKKFVGQGETTISSNPQAAFPVASVIVSLWNCIPEFGHLFLAYCFKECPFLVPYFIPQKKGQSIEDYSKVLGYKITEGQLEKQEMYLKRQTGIARLYAAVMVTNGRQQDGPSHPYGLEHAWRWLTNIVTLVPLPDISATLITEILQIVGSGLWSSYGKQFVKLLLYIQSHYFPKLSAVDEGGPKARLELLLSNFLRDGQIQKPVGMLPPAFW